MKGTPLPRWAYVSARVGSTVLIVVAMAALTLGLGAAAYDVHVRLATLPGVLITLALGTAAFTTLGIGVTRFIPNAESAPVFVNLSVLPLTFISSIWFPTDNMPQALKTIAGIFPLRPLAEGLQYAFNPHTTGIWLKAQDVRTLAIWTVVGIVLMVRFLREPEREN